MSARQVEYTKIIADDLETEILILVQDAHTPHEVLDNLANNPRWDIRYYVAWNPNTSVETLDKLYNDEIWEIQYRVASHPNALAKTLTKLAESPSKSIRLVVAEHPNCPTLIRLWLADDGYAGLSLAEFLEKVE